MLEEQATVVDLEVHDDSLVHGLQVRCGVGRKKLQGDGFEAGDVRMCHAVVDDYWDFALLSREATVKAMNSLAEQV